MTVHRANFLTLSKRLRGLVDKAGGHAKRLIPSRRSDFISSVTATRNYLTHRGRGVGRVLEGRDLFWHSQALIWLLRIHFLERLGFDDQVISRIAAQNRSFS